jgi:hypothetical protein
VGDEAVSLERELSTLRAAREMLLGERLRILDSISRITNAHKHEPDLSRVKALQRDQELLLDLNRQLQEADREIARAEQRLAATRSANGLSEFLPPAPRAGPGDHQRHQEWLSEAQKMVLDSQRALSRFLTTASAASVGIILTLLDTAGLTWTSDQKARMLWASVVGLFGIITGIGWYFAGVLHAMQRRKVLRDWRGDPLPELLMALDHNEFIEQGQRWTIIAVQFLLWFAVIVLVVSTFGLASPV